MINLIDIERRYHHLEGDFCDITSFISLWGILRKNLRKRSTYINIPCFDAPQGIVALVFWDPLHIKFKVSAVRFADPSNIKFYIKL